MRQLLSTMVCYLAEIKILQALYLIYLNDLVSAGP